MAAVLTPPHRISELARQQGCREQLLGANPDLKLSTLARLAEQQVPLNDYWRTTFAKDIPEANRHQQAQRQTLAIEAYALGRLLPEGTYLVDLGCGPSTVLEEFFRTHFPTKLEAWIGVDAIAECIQRKPFMSERNRAIADVPSLRIQADALSFLQTVQPAEDVRLSFYIANWPNSFSESYVEDACSRIDQLTSPGSLIFVSCPSVEKAFQSRPELYERTNCVGSGKTISLFKKL